MDRTDKVLITLLCVYVGLAVLGMADTLWVFAVDSAADALSPNPPQSAQSPTSGNASIRIQTDTNQKAAYITLTTPIGEWSRWFHHTELAPWNVSACGYIYEQFSRPYEVQTNQSQQVFRSDENFGHWESVRFRMSDTPANRTDRIPLVIIYRSWPQPVQGPQGVDSCAPYYPPPSSVIPPPPPRIPSVLTPQADVAPQSGISGLWDLRYESQPDGVVITTIRLNLNGTQIEGNGEKIGDLWRGRGEFDGRTGYYIWTLPNGRGGRTEIYLDEEGFLHGKVRGASNWDYRGTRR
jgi:hypothetical protein